MQVNLESIHLNHDPTSEATGAFSIRKNETIDVVLPEWRRGQSFRPEDAPAAYAFELVKKLMTAKQRITIKAEFSCDDLHVKEVLVKADDGHVNRVNVLGTVAQTPVRFANGRGGATFFLESVIIPDLGVGAGDVIWSWKYSVDGGTNWNCITTTSHRIYTVIEMPYDPWQPSSRDITNTQLPWTEVLEFSCNVAVATKDDLDEAATKVTRWTHSLGPSFVQYDNPSGGWQGFTFEHPARFDCSQFLLLLNRAKTLQGQRVNCDDTAAIVTSFANILGCRLREGKISAATNFLLNPNIKIGLEQDMNGFFGRHNVGWLGNLPEGRLFDACVQLDFEGSPTQQPFTFMVPTNIIFGDYRPRLTTDATCVPRRLLPVRKIGLAARHLSAKGLDMLKALPEFRLRASDLDSALDFIDFRFIEIDLAEYLFQSFWRPQVDRDVAFGIDMYEVGTGKSTAPLVQNVLDRFHLRPERMDDPSFSEAYTSKGNFTIVFARNQFVFLVRNTGRKVIPSKDLAKFIDELILAT